MMPHDCLMFVPRDIGAQIMSLVLGSLSLMPQARAAWDKATGARVLALEDGAMKR